MTDDRPRIDAAPAYATANDQRDYTTQYDLAGEALSRNYDDVVEHLLEKCPVAHSPDGHGYWVLHKYADVAKAAKDWQTFSSAQGFIANRPEGQPLMPPIETDPPLHSELRRAFAGYLTISKVKKYEAEIRQICTDLIDGFIGHGEVEVVSEYGNQVGGRVFCVTVAGMPAEDMPYLQKCFQDAFHAPTPEERGGSYAKAMEYISDYLKAREAEEPRGDIVDAVLAFDAPGFDFTQKVLTMGLLTHGGIGTTGSIIASGLNHLATHPDVRQRLLDDPSLIPSAVEEFVRFFASAPQLGRVATRDVEIGGVQVKEGEWIVLQYGAANRDPEMFPNPRTVDIERRPNPHMGFAYGNHACMGQHLARLDLRIAFEEFLARIPEFSLPAGFEIEYITGLSRDVVRLPLTFPSGP